MKFKFPFEYVVGPGRGLAQSSLVRSSAIENAGYAFGQAGLKFYVNALNDNLMVMDRQIHPVERDHKLAIFAVYNSLNNGSSPAWQFSVDQSLIQLPSVDNDTPAKLRTADGSILVFTKDFTTNPWWYPPATTANDPVLMRDDTLALWVVQYPGKRMERYNDQGQLVAVVNARHEIMTYNYNDDGTLYSITGPSGTIYRFVYSSQPDGGQVVTLDMAEPGSKVRLLNTYVFDKLKRLVQSKTTDGYVTTYSYWADTGAITRVTQSDNTEIDFGFQPNQSNGRLAYVGYAGGRYQLTRSGNVITIDRLALGKLTLTLNADQQIEAIQEERGFTKSDGSYYNRALTYDAGRLASIKHRDGTTTRYSYTTDAFVFMNEITERNGLRVNFIYDNDHNTALRVKLITESNGSLYSHRYVYSVTTVSPSSMEEVKVLKFTVSPMGQVTEHLYDAQQRPTGQRIYLGAYFPVKNYVPEGQISYAALSEWLTKQDRVNTRLVETTPNLRGQAQTIRRYTTLDASGNGVVTPDMGLIQQYVTGLNEKMTYNEYFTPDYAAHQDWQYDGLSRMTYHRAICSGQDLITTHSYTTAPGTQYNDPGSLEKTILPNGRTVDKFFTHVGLMHQMTRSASNGSTKESRIEAMYSSPGVPRYEAFYQPDQREHYTFHDMQSHVGYRVSPTGIVLSSLVDLSARSETMTAYATPISIKKLFLNLPYDPSSVPQTETLKQLLKNQGQQPANRQSYHFYYPNGDLRYEVDAAGGLIEHQRSEQYWKLGEIHYQEPVSADELETLLSGGELTREVDITKDRYTRQFYNADGHLIAKIDPAGFLTEYQRNVVGEVVQEIRYATAVPHSGDFPAIRPAPNVDHDAHHYYFRNVRGQVMLEVDAENAVIAHTYFANGLKESETHYVTKLDPDWDRSIMPAVPAANSEDRHLSFKYDEQRRLVETINPHGLSHYKIYDKMGKLLLDRAYDRRVINDPTDNTNVKLADPDCCRTTEAHYDQWEQVSASANRRVGQLIAKIATDPNFTPDEKQEKIAEIWETQSARYTYDDTGLKLTSTNTLGEVTQYFYDDERRLVLVIDPVGAATKHTYNAFKEVESTQQYYNLVDLSKLPTDRTSGFVTDVVLGLLKADAEHDAINAYMFDQRGKLTKHTDPEGYDTTFTYNTFGEIETKNTAINSKVPDLTTAYEYDLRGNWTKETRAAEGETIVHQRNFNNLHNQLERSTNPLGGTKTFTFDRLGRVLTVTDENQVMQHDRVLDAFGRVSYDRRPDGIENHVYDQIAGTHTIIHAVGGTETIKTTNVFEETVALQNALDIENEVAVRYAHDAGGKVVLMQDRLGHETIDDYDTEGQHRSHTHPDLGLDEQPTVDAYDYTAAGKLQRYTRDKNDRALVESHAPNAFGFDEVFTNARGVVANNTYSRRGELLTVVHDVNGIDGLSAVKATHQYTYNGQRHRVSAIQGNTAQPNQYAVSFGHDGFGRNTGKVIDPETLAPAGVTSLDITQQNTLDKMGRVIKHVDPRQNVTYLYHDLRGKLRFKVNPDLSVIEYQYDAVGNRTLRRVYDQRAPQGQITDKSTLGDVIKLMSPLASTEDTRVYTYHDANRKLQFTVTQIGDAGFIKEYRYNRAEHQVGLVGYANTMPGDFSQVTLNQINVWVADKANHSSQDRLTQYVLDMKGQQRFVFQPNGEVIENRFDARGRIITVIHYGQFIVDPSPYLHMQPDQIKIPDNPAKPNEITYTIFDLFNKPVYVVKGTSVVAYQHGNTGHVISECHFVDPITVPDNYQDLVVLCRGLKPDRTKDNIKETAYDALDHMRAVTDPLNFQDVYERDALGNMTVHSDRKKDKWTFEYDRAKRQVLKTSPPVTFPIIENDSATGRYKMTGTAIRTVSDRHTYDASNNVLSITLDDGQPNARTMEFAYAAMNHMTGTTIRGVEINDASMPADFDNLPIKKVDVTTSKRFNTKGHCIVECSELGAYKFSVYDNAERLIYEFNTRDNQVFVKAYQRNVFGEKVGETQYNTPANLEFGQYVDTGVPLAAAKAAIVADGKHDIQKTIARDNRGKVQSIVDSPVVCYLPEHNSTTISMATPTTTYIDGLHSQRIVIRRQRFPGHPELDYRKRQWWNEHKKLIAEAESVLLSVDEGSLTKSTVQFKVTIYEYNGKQDRVRTTHWANPLKEVPDETMSYDDLIALHVPSDDDIVREDEYDQASQLTKSHLLSLEYDTIKIAAGGNVVTSQVADRATTEYGYTPVGMRSFEIKPGGSKTCMFYDGRNKVAIQTGEPFTTNSPLDGTSMTMVPLQMVYHDPFKQKLVEVMYFMGAKPLEAGKFPEPLSPSDAHDAFQFYISDSRGAPRAIQDPNGSITIKLVDAARNLVRHFSRLTNYVPDNADTPTKAVAKTHIEETQLSRDNQGNVLLNTVLRDHQEVQHTAFAIDSFHRVISAGDTQNPDALFTQFDRRGMPLITNDNKHGIPVIELRDLLGKVTGYLRSSTLILRGMTEDAIITLLKDVTQRKAYDLENVLADFKGDPLLTLHPPVTCYSGDVPRNLVLSLGVVADAAARTVTISWPQLHDIASKPVLKIYLDDQKSDAHTFEPVVENQLSTVVISGDLYDQLPTDVYSYELIYYYIDPTTGEKTNPDFEAHGVFSIDTDNDAKSTHLVAEVSQPALLQLFGHTAGLTAVNLYQSDTLVGSYPVKPISTGRGFEVDLFNAKTASGDPLPSGVYDIKGVRSGAVDDFVSPAATLYTATPAMYPLPLTFSYNAECLVHDTLGELLIWNQLPVIYQDHSVTLVVNYLYQDGDDEKPFKDTVTIKPGTVIPGGHYVDPDGNTMDANFKFTHPVKTLVDLSVSLILDADNTLPLYELAIPTSQEREIISTYSYRGFKRTLRYESTLESRLDDWELVDAPSEDDDWELVSAGDAADDTPIVTNQFEIKMVCYITSLPGHDGTQPTIEYNDITRGATADVVRQQAVFANKEGVLLNVIGNLDAAYPWRLKGESQWQPYPLVIGLGGAYYESDPHDDAELVTIYPTDAIRKDVFGNKVALIDGDGNTTLRTFDKNNKLKRVDAPPAPMMDDDGVFHASMPTSRFYHRDIDGQRIGITNERGCTEVTERDEAGHVKIKAVGDGVITQTNIVIDGMGRSWTYTDSNGNPWQTEYDCVKGVLSVTTPMKIKNSYTLNERGERIELQDPHGYVRLLGYGIRKGWLTLQQMPSGRIKIMVMHRSGQIANMIVGAVSGDPNKQGMLSSVFDFFGNELSKTLMDGVTVTNTLDKQNLVVKITSTDPKRSYKIPVMTHEDKFLMHGDFWELQEFSVKPQHVEQTFSGGLLVRHDNIAENKSSRLGYDQRRLQVLQDDTTPELVHRRRGEYGPRKHLLSTRDTNGIFTFQVGPTGNPRRRIGRMTASDGTVIMLDIGSTYDAAERPLIADGPWNAATHRPELAEGQGSEYTYANNIRQSERVVREGATYNSTLITDSDLRLIETNTVNVSTNATSTTKRTYDKDLLATYHESNSSYEETRTIIKRNPDEMVIHDDTTVTRGARPAQNLSVTSLNRDGSPVGQTSNIKGSHPVTISYVNEYHPFDMEQLRRVTGTTDNGHGNKSQIPPADQYQDANRMIRSRTGVDRGDQGSGDNYRDGVQVFEVLFGGVIARNRFFVLKHNFFYNRLEISRESYMFYSVNGEPIASYMRNPDPRDDLAVSAASQQGPLFHASVRPTGTGGGALTAPSRHAVVNSVTQRRDPNKNQFALVSSTQNVVNRPSPQTLSDYEALTGSSDHDQFNNSIPRPESSFPPADASTFVPSEPMTAAQISQARFSTPSEANNIALANGNLPLDHVYPAQSIVNIPDLRVALSGSDSSVAISIMMQAMKGSLSPHVTFAPIKHKHHCVEKIIHIVIQIVSSIIASVIPGGIIFTALEAGLIDMSMQAAAKATHLIKHFDWGEVLDTAISAGMQAGFAGQGWLAKGAMGKSAIGSYSAVSGKAGSTILTSVNKYAHESLFNAMLVNAAEQAATNVATQFANMAVGLQKQFDLKSVFETMAMAVLDTGVQHALPLPTSKAMPSIGFRLERAAIRDAESMAESVVADAIVGGSVDLESAALNGLGAALNEFASDITNPDRMRPRTRSKQSAHSNQHGAHHLEESGHGVHHDYHQHHDAGRGIAYAETGLPNEPGAWHDAFEEGMSFLNNTSNRSATDVNHQLSTSVTHADAYHASRMADSCYNVVMSVLNSDPDTLQRMAYHNETHQGLAANATNSHVTISSHTGTPKPHTNDLLPNRGNTTEDVGDWMKSKLSLFGAKMMTGMHDLSVAANSFGHTMEHEVEDRWHELSTESPEKFISKLTAMPSRVPSPRETIMSEWRELTGDIQSVDKFFTTASSLHGDSRYAYIGRSLAHGVTYAGNKAVLFVGSSRGEDEIVFPNEESTIKHIFRNASGHLNDTPENRQLIKSVANDKNNYLGKDKYGTDWYGQSNPDGSQTWVTVRNGSITNGGINALQKIFHSETGLSSPVLPNIRKEK